MIYVYLAQGFEETEAIAPIDMLKRAGKDVITIGIGDNIITGSHGISIIPDTIAQEAPLNDELEMIVLPGGMPGTLNLENSLGHKGVLKGKKAVCFSGFEKELFGAEIGDGLVCEDGIFITARGAGCAVDFGLKLVEKVASEAESTKIRNSIHRDK